MGIPNTVNSYGWTMAVHGEFCTGCDARSGRCGELTREVKAAEQKSVDELKVELQGLLAVTDVMTPLEAERLRQILRTGNNWFVTKPLDKTKMGVLSQGDTIWRGKYVIRC